MGFLPIFITLGAFVFLFAIVVHRNFQKKKKDYFTLLEQFDLLLSELEGLPQADFPKTESRSIKKLEARFHSQEGPDGKNVHLEKLSNVKQYLKEAKRIRYQYQNLLQTKPYSFVGKLMGHRPI